MAFVDFLWNLRKCVFKHFIFMVWVLMAADCLSLVVVYLALVQVSLRTKVPMCAMSSSVSCMEEQWFEFIFKSGMFFLFISFLFLLPNRKKSFSCWKLRFHVSLLILFPFLVEPKTLPLCMQASFFIARNHTELAWKRGFWLTHPKFCCSTSCLSTFSKYSSRWLIPSFLTYHVGK